MTDKKIPEGWKETELGLLPMNWDVEKLKNHLIIKGRIGWKGLKKSEYLEKGYAIINGEQIVDNKINWNAVGRITKERFLEKALLYAIKPLI